MDLQVKVWTALAALFIDNEVGPTEFVQAADVLTEACIKPQEAERILCQEVAPVFATNLWATAGEWQPWSEADVARIMVRHLPRNPVQNLVYRFRIWMTAGTASALWEQLAPHLSK